MNTKNKKSLSLVTFFTFALATVAILLTYVSTSGIANFDGGVAACNNEAHNGYHYSENMTTGCNTSGNKEFWACCSCHQQFLSNPGGAFSNSADPFISNDHHIAYLKSSASRHHVVSAYPTEAEHDSEVNNGDSGHWITTKDSRVYQGFFVSSNTSPGGTQGWINPSEKNAGFLSVYCSIWSDALLDQYLYSATYTFKNDEYIQGDKISLDWAFGNNKKTSIFLKISGNTTDDEEIDIITDQEFNPSGEQSGSLEFTLESAKTLKSIKFEAKTKEKGNSIACFKNIYFYSSAAAHTFGDWIVDKEPTILEPGSKHRICSACGYREDAEIKPTITKEMVITAIDNIPTLETFNGTYNGLVDPFTDKADAMVTAYTNAGGSVTDITNIAKLNSTKDSLSMYDISADNKIDASIFSSSSSTEDPVEDYVNSGYKFVTKVDIGEYVSICYFNKTKMAELKDQLTGAESISLGVKVSKDVKIQPQMSYDDGSGGTAYKAPVGVTETKAGKWLFLTLDSSWVDLLLSDSFKLFYITTMTGASATAGLEVTVADIYIDKTVTAKSFKNDAWSVDGQTWYYEASDSINPYDSSIFTKTSIADIMYPFIDRWSKTSVLTANEAVTADTNVYIKGSGLNGSVAKIRLIFYVNGEMTLSNVEFIRANSVTSSTKDVILNQPVTYTTGWHYLDTTSGSTQYYGYFNFTISAITKGSTLSIAQSGVLTKTA